MKENIQHFIDSHYGQAEKKAARYLETLHRLVKEQSYVPLLMDDFAKWQKNHVRKRSWISLFAKGSDAGNYGKHIQWLNRSGKLDGYLHRSVSYLYLRDLGKAMDLPETQAKIERMTASLKTYLLRSSEQKRASGPEFLSMAEMYRWGQKEGVESAVIWVIGKLRNVASRIPEGMDAEQAQRKLMKIIIGVVLHALEEMGDRLPQAERSRRLDEAIRLGYSYGLTYPFIDDLLDSRVLSPRQKEQYSGMIHTALLTGTVPELGEWVRDGGNADEIRFIHSELCDAFDYLKDHQPPATRTAFFEHSYALFRSQETDRSKTLSHPDYTNEELYIPIILKSASSRLVARSAIGAPLDEGFEDRTFYYGIYNQLADDFADLFDDEKDGAVTPYTYYLKYRGQRPDLLNPYEMYWAVIAYLLHDVYKEDEQVREVILDRAINGMKRCRARLGATKYDELMRVFASGHKEFQRLLLKMERKADDVEFFDKLIRDEMISKLRSEKKEKEAFYDTVQTVRRQINESLQIAKPADVAPMKAPLIDAANYSLEGDGKRMRPILTWVMGVHEYGLDPSAIVPLLRSLEYMHTASLIFDDLPSQDNASTRRGRPTLHEVHNIATAELTGLFLIQKAIQEQSSLEGFNDKAVLDLIHYSSSRAGDLCMGQAMDLHAKGKQLTLEQLDTICYYKTGIAFEAALVMPAILARVGEQEIASLKTFAYHAGIAFQIKDDLLDIEGNVLSLGKSVGKDAENNTSTFVSVLGRDEAKKAMWDHYCRAMDALKAMPRNTSFLKLFLDYMITRNR